MRPLRRAAILAMLVVLAGCKRHAGSAVCAAGDLAAVHPRVRLDQSLSPREARIGVIGTTFVVVWSGGTDTDSDLFARAVDSFSVPVSAEVRLTNITGRSQHPRFAAGAGGLGLAWEDDRQGRLDTFGAVLGSSLGPVLGHAFVAPDISTTQDPRPAIATFGTAFRLVWNAPGPDGVDHLWTAPMGRDGSAPGAPVLVDPALGDRHAAYPEAVAFGNTMAVVDDAQPNGVPAPPDVFAYLLSTTGGIGASYRFAPNSPARMPAVAFDDAGDAAVLWCDKRTGQEQIYFGSFGTTTAGIITPERAVSAAPACEPALAGGQSFFLATWSEQAPSGRAIRFQSLHRDGIPDLVPKTIASDSDASPELHRPDIAWNGRVVGVSWIGAQGGVWFQPLECTLGDFAGASPTPSATP